MSATLNFSDRARNAFEEPQRSLAELSPNTTAAAERYRKTRAHNGTRLECTQMQDERSSRIVTKIGARRPKSGVQITRRNVPILLTRDVNKRARVYSLWLFL